ncbi:MAG: S8 family serine peptidase [Myxococcota bacterium]|nr:S8 family serine peptidase [Myxococcota bacterium]
MDQSREHNDCYRKREARELEALRSEAGGDVIGKLDRVVLREVLYARRQNEFEKLMKMDQDACPARVMVNLKSGLRQDVKTAEAFKARVVDKAKISPPAVTAIERRRRARIRGEKATARLKENCESRGVPVKKEMWLTHSLVIEAGEADIIRLAQRRDVNSINHDKRAFVANLDVSRPLIRADDVESSLGYTGNGIDVAVLDTGVDFNHAALAGSMGSQPAPDPGLGEGVGDFHGHGSHCAGVVGSRDGGRRGVAPACTIHDIKIMDQFGSSSPAIAVAGIQEAVNQGVDVASNSWGWTHADGMWDCPEGQCVLCEAADNAVNNSGLVFVVSAGNSNNDTCSEYDSHIGCPGNAREAITIGASDDGDAMADFSSIGPTPDGRSKPDVTAPGVDIGSVRATTGSDMLGNADPIDADWIDASGTSMSCPHVAGLCALMLEKNPAATPADIKRTLMDTAVDIGATVDEMGAGRVDAVDAVNAI